MKRIAVNNASFVTPQSSPIMQPQVCVWYVLSYVILSLTFPLQLPLIPRHTTFSLPFPQDAKDIPWFQDAFVYTNINLGGPYTNLVERWIILERINRWTLTQTGLPNKSKRPPQLSAWIVSGRYGKRSKKIFLSQAELDDFGVQFWNWWTFLQPGWRGVGPDKRPLPVVELGEDWKCLDYSGPNGWLSLLACLKWWGEGLETVDDDVKEKDWLKAVNDVAMMLEGLILYKQRQ